MDSINDILIFLPAPKIKRKALSFKRGLFLTFGGRIIGVSGYCYS